ncbi:MAG: C40 family peptidase, partial [Rhizobiaceae bacterium]
VQLSMYMCGKFVPRDSDMQFSQIGELIEPGEHFENLERGDLIFWPGHVAIVEGDGNLLHANGYTMDVTSEPLVPALGRIAEYFSAPSGFVRP